MTEATHTAVAVEQRSDEWRRLRAGRITGSRIGEAIGLIGSRRRLWRELTGREPPPEENDAMRRGTTFEPLVCALYEAYTGQSVEHVGFYIDTEFDWLGASPDGLVGDAGSVEFKFPMGRMYDAPPPYYLAQVHGVMRCTGRKWCDLMAYKQDIEVGVDEARIWRVHFSDDLWEEIMGHLLMFREFIVDDVEPPRFGRGERPALRSPITIDAPINL